MRKKQPSFRDSITGDGEKLEIKTEHILESSFSGKPSWNQATATLEPLTNAFVTARMVVITADLPYVDIAAINVRAIGSDLIEIEAKTKRKISFTEFGFTHRKGEFSRFYVQVRTPVPIDSSKLSTMCNRGILEIHVPRKLSRQ